VEYNYHYDLGFAGERKKVTETSGRIVGAVFGGIDAGLGGENIVEGALMGEISGAAFGALATFSSIRPLLGIMGVASGLEGVEAALEEEDYDLAAWRAAICITAIVSLKSELFNKTACFTEETLIYTKDGYKQIKDIEVGDEVYSENADTGEQGLKKVVNVFVKESNELIHLQVGDQEIKTTATHPFWVEGRGWVDAGDLKQGDRLVMYSDEILEVKEAYVEYLDKPIKVYNFEVEDWHTYFVSEYNVFVHNAGCGPKGGSNAKGRSANDLKPDPDATGPHTTFKRDPDTGKITNYETWKKSDPRNPNPFESEIRFDGKGQPHTNKVTMEDLMPHVHDKTVPGGVRVPYPRDLPLGY